MCATKKKPRKKRNHAIEKKTNSMAKPTPSPRDRFADTQKKSYNQKKQFNKKYKIIYKTKQKEEMTQVKDKSKRQFKTNTL